MTTIEKLSTEVQKLEQALNEPEIDKQTEAATRERLAFATARLADLEFAAGYADITDEDLAIALEDDAFRREELGLQVKAAKDANRPALARKLQREFAELADHQASLKTEADRRVLAAANAVGVRQNAERRAEREIRQADAEALKGLEDFQRPMAQHKLEESRANRIARRAEELEPELWASYERAIGAEMIQGRGAVPTEMPTATEEIEE